MSDQLPPAHWAKDPSGQYEYRWWDGAKWTGLVADNGVERVDPLFPTGAPVTTATTTASVVTPTAQATMTQDVAVADTPAGTEVVHPTPPPGESTRPVGADAIPALPAERPTGAAAIPPLPPLAAAEQTFNPSRGRVVVRGDGIWRSLDGLRTALIVLNVCAVAAGAWLMVALLNRLSLVDDLETGLVSIEFVQQAQNADDTVQAAGLATLVVFVVTFIVFIVWQWRCAKNAEVVGRYVGKWSPGWSIGGWFIPFANFVIPILVLQDLWRASDPNAEPVQHTRPRGSGLLTAWWVVFLVSTVAMNVIDADSADTLDQFRSSNHMLMAFVALSVISAVMTIGIVVQMTSRYNVLRDEAASLTTS